MANAQIAAHDAVCNPTTEFDSLSIGSLIRAAETYRELARRLYDESDRPVNAKEPAASYFDDAATDLARKSELAYEILQRRKPQNKHDADSRARALIEWYSSTGDSPENILTAVASLMKAGQEIH